MRPPSDGAAIAAVAVAFPTAIAAGGVIYRLLGRWRDRSRAHLFLARTWAWFMALVAGQGAAVAVAGPCAFCGRMRGGGWNNDPLTVREALVIAAVLAVAYAAAMTFLRPPHGDRPE